jgi:hypothetical protein
VLRLCDRFRCTPDGAYRLDATVLGLLEIEDLMGWREVNSEEWPPM